MSALSSSVRWAASGSARRAPAELRLALGGQAAARLGDRGGEDHQGRHLGHERLRGGDRHLGPGLQEEDRVGLAGDRRADRVRHRDHRAALLAGEAGRGDRVGRLARLGHGDDQRLGIERRRAVAELRADRRPGRQAGPVLEGGGADQGGVEGRAAGHQLDPPDPGEPVAEAGQLIDDDLVGAAHPAGDRLAQGGRLLVDLLEHEMVEAALLGGLGRPGDRGHGALDRAGRRHR